MGSSDWVELEREARAHNPTLHRAANMVRTKNTAVKGVRRKAPRRGVSIASKRHVQGVTSHMLKKHNKPKQPGVTLCLGDSILDHRFYVKPGQSTEDFLTLDFPGQIVFLAVEETQTSDFLNGGVRNVPKYFFDAAKRKGSPYTSKSYNLYPPLKGINSVFISIGGNDVVLNPSDAFDILTGSSLKKEDLVKRVLQVLASYPKKYKTLSKACVYYIKPYYLDEKAGAALLGRYAGDVGTFGNFMIHQPINALIDEICARVSEEGFTVVDPKWKPNHVMISKFGIPEPSPAGAKHLANVISSYVIQK